MYFDILVLVVVVPIFKKQAYNVGLLINTTKMQKVNYTVNYVSLNTDTARVSDDIGKINRYKLNTIFLQNCRCQGTLL